jgi:putative transposase
VTGFARSSWYRVRTRSTPAALEGRLRTLAHERPRFGYRRLHVLLRREGFQVNHKRVWRIYRAEGLAVRRRRRKRVCAAPRRVLAPPTAANQRWSMDFVQDGTVNGRRFRVLCVVDDFTRECLALVTDTSITGARVARELQWLTSTRARPEVLVSDNGPEFTGKAMDAWAYGLGIKLHFIRPGKPMDNGYVESFNGKFRDECLNAHWFNNLDHARSVIATWKDDYNDFRPHSSLGDAAPTEYARRQQRLA